MVFLLLHLTCSDAKVRFSHCLQVVCSSETQIRSTLLSVWPSSCTTPAQTPLKPRSTWCLTWTTSRQPTASPSPTPVSLSAVWLLLPHNSHCFPLKKTRCCPQNLRLSCSVMLNVKVILGTTMLRISLKDVLRREAVTQEQRRFSLSH